MNMMKNDKFEQNTVLERDASAQNANPALAQLMKAWESKNARHAKRAGGFGLMAVSLAACGSDGDGGSSDDDGTTPVAEGGIWSLVAGGLQLAGDFDPALFAGGVLPAGVLIGAPAVLTPTSTDFVNGDGNPAGGDDLVLSTSGSFTGAVVDLGEGDDTVFIDVTGNTIAGLVTNVETVELANSTLFGASLVNLSTVVDVENVTISETSAAGGNLQVTNIRNTADIEVQGNFNNNVFIDFLNATGPLNLTVNDYFQNAGSLNIAQDFTAINVTSAGEGTLNAIDAGALGANLQSLTIDGTVDFEVIGGAVAFRAATPAVIDASGFEGDNLTLAVAGHNDVSFTGSDANDALSVTTAPAAVGPDNVITLTADLGAGDNTLTINAGAFQSFVTPESTIASDGDLELIIAGGNVDMTQPDADGNLLDLSAVTSVTITQGAILNLTAEQVTEIGIDNFSTPDFGNATGALNITGVDDTPLDLSGIDVGTVVTLTTVPGDVTLDPTTVLGNTNTGVAAVIVDNRGTDSTVTMTAEQFQQLDGTGEVTGRGGPGTNNPATGEPFETGLVLTDLDPDTEYDLGEVDTDTTDVQLNNFTAGADFDLTDIGTTELTVTLSGDVDLSESGAFAVDNLVFSDGAVLTTAGEPTVNNEIVFEGAATLNNVDNSTVLFDTDNISGDASQVVLNFEGTGPAVLNVEGSSDLTLKAVNAGNDTTSLTVNNNLDAGATLDITGGSPAMTLGEDTTDLTVTGDAETTTLIGTDPGEPDIVSSSLTTITATAGTDAVINLGTLDGVTSDTLTVDGNNDPSNAATGTTTVEITDVPAGAAWEFNGVELVINDVAGFGAGATIKLGAGTTLAGDATLADISPFLTSDSIVPLDASSTAAEITTVLQSLQANQATVDVTGMDLDQLTAVVDNSLKVATANGDLTLTADLTVFQINTLSGKYAQGMDDVLTIDADGMTTAQKAASAGAVAGNTTDVINLTLDSDDSAGDIGILLAETANNSTVVEAADMDAGQLNALVGNMPNVNVINDMTLTNGNVDTQITALLSKAAPQSVTVDAEFMGNDQFAAIEEQITKIAADGVENLTVTALEPDQDFQVTALLELAVDAEVNALNMSDNRLSIVAENIDNIADDGITGPLTVTADQTAAEITSLVSKAPDGTVIVDLSDMDTDQVDAVTAASDKVANLTVGENSSVTLTLAQFATLDSDGLTPIIGAAATDAANTGGAITIIADADGTLDLSLVSAGAGSAPADDNGGTLTLQVEDGFTLSVEGALPGQNENLAVSGTGTLAVTENLNLVGQNLTVAGGMTIDLAPDVTLTLTAEQADALAVDGVTITKAAATAPAVEGEIFVSGGFEVVANEPLDLSALDLSLVDRFDPLEGDGTILSADPAKLPAQIGVGFADPVLVDVDSDWSTYDGVLNANVNVSANATLTLNADTAEAFANTGFQITGEASGAGETGGSIVITDLDDTEINLSGLDGDVLPGTGGAGDDGTFVVSVSTDVTLDQNTILPTTADVIIDDGATLGVNGGTAQADGSNAYEGLGTLNFVDLDGIAVAADSEVRFNSFTFEDTDTNVTINGFESANAVILPDGNVLSGTNGQFLFEGTTLGTMSLDLSNFTTSGTGFDTIPDNTTATDLNGVGVIVVEDGTDPTTLDFSGANNGEDAQIFFAFENGANTEVQYWSDDGAGTGTASDGIVDTDELTLVATLDDTGTDQLGSENFTV
ncbi:beta strand repeat-containing protein [Roseovarius sp. D22-M7]|uniref:beta strand repeat-containing protein n=1 Tax=Roseovarius sp. D22-M7 TaxID=3127116 RepID=UPI0030105571